MVLTKAEAVETAAFRIVEVFDAALNRCTHGQIRYLSIVWQGMSDRGRSKILAVTADRLEDTRGCLLSALPMSGVRSILDIQAGFEAAEQEPPDRHIPPKAAALSLRWMRGFAEAWRALDDRAVSELAAAVDQEVARIQETGLPGPAEAQAVPSPEARSAAIREFIEGFGSILHRAVRVGVDSPFSALAWRIIRDTDSRVWQAFVSVSAEMLRQRGVETSTFTGESLQAVLLSASEDIGLEQGFERLVGRAMGSDEAEDAVMLRLMLRAMPVKDYADIAGWIEWSIRERAVMIGREASQAGTAPGSGGLHHA